MQAAPGWVAEHMGWTVTESWTSRGRYDTTQPSKRLLGLLDLQRSRNSFALFTLLLAFFLYLMVTVGRFDTGAPDRDAVASRRYWNGRMAVPRRLASGPSTSASSSSPVGEAC